MLDLAEPVLKHRMALTFSARARHAPFPMYPAIEGSDRLMAVGIRYSKRERSTAIRRRADGESRLPPGFAAAPRAGKPAWIAAKLKLSTACMGCVCAGPGAELLAIPPFRFRRAVAAGRLAPLGARDDHLYVREQEWEAAHTVWLWPDRSPSMAFASRQSRDSKSVRPDRGHLRRSPSFWWPANVLHLPAYESPTASRSDFDKMAKATPHMTEAAGSACRRPSCLRAGRDRGASDLRSPIVK